MCDICKESKNKGYEEIIKEDNVLKRFACILLTVVLVISITTVSLASEVAKNNGQNRNAGEINLWELDEFKIEAVIKGDTKKIPSGKTRTWDFRDVDSTDKKVYVLLDFENFEDGTPVVVKLKHRKTGTSCGEWNDTLSESQPSRYIWFFAHSDDREDYILEIKHDDKDYESFSVTPRILEQ